MGSLHTGSDNLVYIETPSFSITIKGSASHPSLPGVAFNEEKASISVESREVIKTAQFFTPCEMINSFQSNGLYFTEYKSQPFFFEQQDYEVVIEPYGEHTVLFYHDNPNLKKKITQTGRDKKLLTGIINFGNDIGYSDLIIRVDNIYYFKLTIEVFPTKIDYKDDYTKLVSDITAEIYNLIFDCFRKTYQSFGISSLKKSSLVEFFAIINKLYERFISSADIILRNPHHLLVTEHELLPFYKIKKTDNATLRWIEKHSDKVSITSDRYIKCEKALAVKKHVTYDTKENRLTKHILLQTAKRLEQFKHLYMNLSRNMDSERIYKINRMCDGIRQRCNSGFMKDVSEAPGNSGMSLVFNMAPGYRNLYKIFLLLQRGLSATGMLYNSSEKDVAVLYEYWCFIKLNSILKSKYNLETSGLIRARFDGISVGLWTDSKNTIKYVNPQNGESITLSYNHTFKQLPTIAQKPDNVLSLEKNGTNTKYEYVLDAKYRVNPANPESDYYKSGYHTPGPEIDTINTMHRYRDAIVCKNIDSSYERLIFGAYVLFPYHNHNSEYENHPFYKSIKEVNIGGLPFLPDETDLVIKLLDELIEASPEETYKSATLPNGLNDFYQSKSRFVAEE